MLLEFCFCNTHYYKPSCYNKGAGRVSEVSARFTLDAMPGKQMAIDADLNAGLLTSEEANNVERILLKKLISMVQWMELLNLLRETLLLAFLSF